MSTTTDATTQAFLDSLKPEDVQAVSSAGVSMTLRDPNETARKKFELERDQRRAAFNPFCFGSFRDRNQRRA